MNAAEPGLALGGGVTETRQQRVRQGARWCRPGLGYARSVRTTVTVQGANRGGGGGGGGGGGTDGAQACGGSGGQGTVGSKLEGRKT